MSTTDNFLARHPSSSTQPAASGVKARFFDGHFHIIDPRFPLVPNQGYLPPAFTLADYRASTANFHVVGGAVVTASFQSFDQRYLVGALLELGPRFVGVTQLPATVSDAMLQDLDTVGVRAVRFNLYRGGSESLDQLERMARRVFDLVGWHVELYIASRDLPDLSTRLLALPRVSIDHLGLTREGLPSVLKLAERGVFVKATGFGRCDFDVPGALRSIYQVNPTSLIFGTDLPSTRAARPFAETDVALILDTLGADAGQRVLMGNASLLYKLA